MLKKKHEILALEESKWWLKSRAVCLHEGDNNFKFFHSYANHRRNLNLILGIETLEGHKVFSFKYIAKVGKAYFSGLFKDPPGCPILEILKVVEIFPRSFTVDMNEYLQAEILEGEVLAIIEAFQKRKIPGPDWLIVEIFLGFYDLLKGDLLKVVQESQQSGKILGSFNKNFLDLIWKKKETVSFEDFVPISCCNMIYNLISKIITNLFNPILSDLIFEEPL
jgi:hypothetical protein